MVALRAISYELPATVATVEELAREGLVVSDVDALRAFGFERAHIATATRMELARAAAQRLFAEHAIEPTSVDAFLYATALPAVPLVHGTDPLELFRYEGPLLQNELGLHRAVSVSIHEGGCVSLFTAIRIAAALIESDDRIERVLCLASDVLPHGCSREIMFNLISDGACAVLVERGTLRNAILSHAQTTKGFYWDAREHRQELIATYFPTARKTIENALQRASVGSDKIALILPHNVNEKSWLVLLDLIAISPQRLYRDNIGLKGHTIAADPLINLHDATVNGRVKKDDLLLLFTFGFGAHWAAMVIRH